jgi:hypothetical protein
MQLVVTQVKVGESWTLDLGEEDVRLLELMRASKIQTA